MIDAEETTLDSDAPPCVIQTTATVVENVPVARDTFRLRLDVPEIARVILPGQFVMIRPGGGNDPLLGRPFALYEVIRDASGKPIGVDIVYLVVGRGTKALAGLREGARVGVWGPLGNGFGPAPSPPGSVIFVAGGIGQTPFLAVGRSWLGRAAYGLKDVGPGRVTSATLLYGVRSREFLAGISDFQDAGIAVEIATDDGTAGHHGYVTDLLASRLERGERPVRVIGCGPPAMLAALARVVALHDIPCDVSLENHMACGFGVCFSCVAPIRQADGTVDLRRVCVEGPVFASKDVAFELAPIH